jgi:hypothetical protein
MPPREAVRENVASLKSYDPHPSRTQAIRSWHVDEIGHEDQPVAILHIAVTAGGQIRSKGLGLDRVHAELILEELEEARATLADYLGKEPQSNVIPLRKTA